VSVLHLCQIQISKTSFNYHQKTFVQMNTNFNKWCQLSKRYESRTYSNSLAIEMRSWRPEILYLESPTCPFDFRKLNQMEWCSSLKFLQKISKRILECLVSTLQHTYTETFMVNTHVYYTTDHITSKGKNELDSVHRGKNTFFFTELFLFSFPDLTKARWTTNL
jgi:hypothetical protein